MNRTNWGAAPLLALLVMAGLPAAGAHCSPPCGPIPVIIELKTERWKGLTFGDASTLEFAGVVSFYINVDQDGFWYDVDEDPTLTFRVNREPPWVKTTIDPEQLPVPVSDAQFLGPEPGGQPTDVQYLWTAPFQVKIVKLRDPTPEELGATSRWIRRDGTFRVTVSASTTSSLLAPEVFGGNMGLQEGYGVREFRFVPEIAGVQWVPDEAGVLRPADGVVPGGPQARGAAPAPWAALVLVALLAVAVRRRRDGG